MRNIIRMGSIIESNWHIQENSSNVAEDFVVGIKISYYVPTVPHKSSL